MLKVLTEVKNTLREKIKMCDICGSKNFKFIKDEVWEDTIVVNCKGCGNRLFIGGVD